MPLLALAFIAGVALIFHCAVLPTPAALADLAVIALVAWLLDAKRLTTALCGIVIAATAGHRAIGNDWPCSRNREQVELSGTIASPAAMRGGRVDFDLDVADEGRPRGVPLRLHLSWYRPAAVPRPGEAWEFAARLNCRSGFANPGGFDRELDLLRRGFGATGYVVDSPRPRRDRGSPLRHPVERARAWIADRIAEATPGSRSTGVLQGLAVGLRSSIEPAVREAIVATGIAHLIAISGMHVTSFAMLALTILRRLYGVGARPSMSAHWPAIQSAAVAVLSIGYGLLAGSSLPTIRTVAMVGLVVLLRGMRRHASMAAVLAATALLLAACDPSATTSAGFWLSFVAVAALLGLLGQRSGLIGAAGNFARAQAAVTLALTPVLAGAFGAVPLVGPAVNAVAIPFFAVLLLPATLAGVALLVVLPAAADRWWAALAAVLDHCWPVLTWAAGLPHAVLHPPSPPGWLLACALAGAFAVVLVPGRSTGLPCGVLLCALLLRAAPVPSPGGFELTVLDVGHGLASVVRTTHHVLVFDTGPGWRSGGSAARVTLTPFLWSLGVEHLDRIVVSHPDADHAGGLGELSHRFDIGIVMGNPGGHGGADRPCVAGDRWRWDGVDFVTLSPPGGVAFSGNDSSCAIRIAGPGGSALLLADPEIRAERFMLAQRPRSDVVIVPHHGSLSSSDPEFVRAVAARWALVPAGFGNRWGLPRPEVVHRWQQAGAEVLTTATGGALQVRVGPGQEPGPAESWRRSNLRWWRR